jgi:hypothetical protein
MVDILRRAFLTVTTVVISIIVSANLGDSAAGKIWTAVFIALFVALVEWFVIWAPEHVAFARRLLDPRASLLGVWLQVVKSTGIPLGEEPNRFAVFWVHHGPHGYEVKGFAFDGHGQQVARWWSEGSPDFAPDGKAMTYQWKGEVIGVPEVANDVDRTGVTRIRLENHTGRVDHVGLKRILFFDFDRISPDTLAQLGLEDVAPEGLKVASTRDRFAVAYAKRLIGAGPQTT